MPRASVEAERREQIMTAACEVVAEIGYRSLRIADVARRAQASTGTVHYYFDTKRELMRAAFEWNFTRSLERRRELLDGDGDALRRLRAFVESYLPRGEETVNAWRVWAELWVEALHDPDLQEVNENVYGEWRRIVAAIIRDGQDAGQFRAGDPVAMANALIGMIDGLSLQVLLRSRSMTVDRMRAVCEQVLDTLVALPG
jgi:AcrR family transcriptional regulator